MSGILGLNGQPLHEEPFQMRIRIDGPMVLLEFSRPVMVLALEPTASMRLSLDLTAAAKKVLLGLVAEEAPAPAGAPPAPSMELRDAPPPNEQGGINGHGEE